MNAHGNVRSQGGAVGAATGDVAVTRGGDFGSSGGGVPLITGDIAVARHAKFDVAGGGLPGIPVAVAVAAHARFHSRGAPDHRRPRRFAVEIGGADYDQVLAGPGAKIEHRLDGNSTASVTVRHLPGAGPRRQPGGQYLVVIRDPDTEAVLFSGVSQGQTRAYEGPQWVHLALRCVGWTLLEGQELTNDEGRLAAKDPTGSAQLARVLPLDRADVRSDPKSIADLRLKKRGFLLAELRRRNEAAVVAKRPTATGVAYALADLDRLPRTGLVLDETTARKLSITEDASAHVRRQRVVAGNITRIRTLYGDGESTRFFLGDRFDALDYLAAGVRGDGPGEVAQDRGVRFREDAIARLSSGSLDLFGGQFPAANTLYLDIYAVAGSQWSLYVDLAANQGLLDYSLPLPAATGAYGLIIENLATERRWASASTRITNAGVPTREADRDLSLSAGFQSNSAPFGHNGRLCVRERLSPDSAAASGKFLAYDPVTAALDPTADLDTDPLLLMGGEKPLAGATMIGQRLWVFGNTFFARNLIQRANYYDFGTSTYGTFASTLIPGTDIRPGLTGSFQLTIYDACSHGGVIWLLGRPTVDGELDDWALWAFQPQDFDQNVAAALATIPEKHIKLDNAKTWVGCAVRGNTIYAINRTDNAAEAFNAFSRQRDPLQALSLGAGSWRQAAGLGTDLLYIVEDDDDLAEAWSGQDRQLEFTFPVGDTAEMAADFAAGDEFRVAVVDTGITGVNLPEFRYDPGPEITVPAPPPRVILDGIEYSVGGPGTRFDFSLPTQELIVHGEPLTAANRIRISYGVRWIGEAAGEGDGYTDSTRSLDTEDDVAGIVALAEELLKEKGVVALRAAFDLHWDVARILRIGELIDVAADPGNWVINQVVLEYRGGGRVAISGECQRDRFTSPNLDWLRALRARS